MNDSNGILYERKRGEFGDGIYNDYIKESEVIERNLFFRLYYASNGNINKAIEKKLFLKQDFSETTIQETDKLDNFYFGFLFFKKIYKSKESINKIEKNTYGQIFAMTVKYKPEHLLNYESAIESNLENFNLDWDEFIKNISSVNTAHLTLYIDKQTKKTVSVFSESNWYKSNLFERDVINYFQNNGKIEDTDNDFGGKLEIIRNKQLLNNNSIEEIEINIQKNKHSLNGTEISLSKLEIRKQELVNKMNSLTDGQKYKRKVLIWLNETENRIKKSLYSQEKYSTWISEDTHKLNS